MASFLRKFRAASPSVEVGVHGAVSDDSDEEPQTRRAERDKYGFAGVPEEEWAFNHSMTYEQKLEKQKQNWAGYLAAVKHADTYERSPELKRLVRNGIPPALRGEVWQTLVRHKLDAQHRSTTMSYAEILKKHEGQTNSDSAAIDKDLRRTFPSNERFESEEGLAMLRRVLIAYSWKNTSVGYAQSMNFLVALLLLFLEEEQAFWMLSVIVEDILPGYYSKSLFGAIVDQRVLSSLVSERLSRLNLHFSKNHVMLESVTMAWFLSIFTSFPLESTMRIWDCIFYEGSKILFRIALGLFKLNEKQLLATTDTGELYTLLNRLPRTAVNPDHLFSVSDFLGITICFFFEKRLFRRNSILLNLSFLCFCSFFFFVQLIGIYIYFF
eukprot:TRINITY_DN2015_c1_g1_i1.p1 TRINITY_DN2015_c1_g1~~TRINITY_DN2015_c1_g1_i1.p1  ORF type:complete len:382 (-),score=58.68 TRINITY_DN2015_c1_g1_i1:27-1172(-)